MKFMVIEYFKTGKEDVYLRYNQFGRMLPDRLKYVNSWITNDRTTCFQIMETEDISLFYKWTKKWEDLTDFQIFPIMESPTKSTQPEIKTHSNSDRSYQ